MLQSDPYQGKSPGWMTMEALSEKNRLEAGLIASLAQLNFENGKPLNTEAVAQEIVETMVAYFVENKGNIEHCWSFIDHAFTPIQILFEDKEDFIVFLYQVVTQIKCKMDSLIENVRYEKTTFADEADDDLNDSSAEFEDHNKAANDEVGSDYQENPDSEIHWAVQRALGVCRDALKDMGHQLETSQIHLIEQQAAAIDSKLPLDERYRIAQNLKEAMAQVASAGKLFVSRRFGFDSEKNPLDPGVISDLSHQSDISFRYIDGGYSLGSFSGTLEAICAIEAEKKLMDSIGYVDREELEKNRLTYGAKGANLLAVQKLLPKFEHTEFEYLAKKISIPMFHLFDIHLFKKWKNQEDIDPHLRQVYEDFKGKPLIVRSSAVNSEDGEQMTGAGIYLSVPLETHSTFEEFRDAVIKVYESCDTDSAKKYRADNSVENEYMGLVIQERIEYPELGYVNSTRPYSDDTTDVKNDQTVPYIFDTPKLDRFTFLKEDSFSILQYASRVQSEILHQEESRFGITYIVAFARILERHYGQPVQIEFSSDIDWTDRSAIFNFFQVRPLPAKMFQIRRMEFPSNIQPIYECLAEGVCDDVLNVLDVYKNNNDDRGFVVYASSWEGSTKKASLDRAMPKEGAVMIIAATEPGRGHIETLALERGVTLLFHSKAHLMRDMEFGTPNTVMSLTREQITQCLAERLLGLRGNFAGNTQVRIVANGKIARIYPVENAPTSPSA